MDTVLGAMIAVLAIGLGGSIGLNLFQHFDHRRVQDRLISALLAEKAPTYTRLEARKQELEAFASIEEDDEGDMPDGLV